MNASDNPPRDTIDTAPVIANLAEAVEVLDDGFVLFDKARCFVFANRRYREMLGPVEYLLVPGTPMAQIIGTAVYSGQITIVGGPDGGMPALLQALEKNDNLQVEVVVADGTHKEISLKRLDGGGMVGTIRNVTGHRQAEIRARELLHSAIEEVDFGIALVDEDARLVFANDRFREIADPAGTLMTPGRTMRDMNLAAIEAGILKVPEGVGLEYFLDELDRMIRNAVKGFSLPVSNGQGIVANVYETKLGDRLLTVENVTQQLRAERLYTDAVARLPVGVAIETAEGRFTHCNDAFAAPFDLTADAILDLGGADRVNKLAPKIDAIDGKSVEGAAKRLFAEAITHQRVSLKPMEVQFRSGRHFLVERAVTQNDGRVVVVTDITALKAAESRSLQMLNDTIQSLDEGLALFDRGLNFLFGNRLWHEMFFRVVPVSEPGETIADVFRRLVDAGVIAVPVDRDQTSYLDDLNRFLSKPGTKIEITLDDGRILLGSAHRTRRDGCLVSFMDVTKQREADLLLQKIVDACPANFLVSRVDDGKIIYCPPPSRERFGNIDSTLSFFLKQEDRQAYLDALLPTGKLDDYRVQFRRADGSTMQGLTAARVTEYKGEQVIISSTRDISDQLQMQEELQMQRDAAHQNEKLSALGELLASVAHELNNPLSIVVGYAQMLEGKIEDPLLSRRVDRIAEAANRSSRIVRAFLAMARQRPAKLEECSLNDVVDSALEIASYGLRSNGTTILTELDSNLPNVSGDQDQLVQVLTNLIVNAEHALAPLREAGQLSIRSFYEPAHNQSVVAVADNGPGIPHEIKARIFEPFYTTKDVGKGTGIGLAFSHRIVDAHDGKLELASDPDQRTCFFVRLPAFARETHAMPDYQTLTRPGAGKSVLVVDDEEAVGELVCDMLETFGCEPVFAGDGHAALEVLRHESFDLILSDFKMPGLDGAAFYRLLIKDRPEYADRIGFITGDAMGDQIFQFLSKHERPYIEKPILQEDLVGLIYQLTPKETVR